MTVPVRMSSRDALIEAAFDVLSRNPSASLAEVAERAGVGRATLHRHFAGRDDLIRALAQTAIVEMDEAAEAACEGVDTYAEALRCTLEALIPLADRHGFLARERVDLDPVIQSEFERQNEEVHGMVEGAKKEGLLDRKTPTGWIARVYDQLLYAAWETVRAGDATPSQAADLAWRTFTSGLGGSSRDT